MLDTNTVIVTNPNDGLDYACNMETGYVVQVATGAAPMLPLANRMFALAMSRRDGLPR